MATTNELPNSPPKPESTAERIAAISELIQGQQDEVQGDAPEGADGGSAVQESVDAESTAEATVLDQQESNAPEGVEDDAQGAAPGDSQDVVTLADLAKHLELEPSDVYELEIPIGDGVTTTLGQLKDEFKEYGPAKEYQKTLEHDRSEFEKQVLQTRAELNAIVSAIPDEMRETVISAGREHQAQWAKEQEKAVLEAIPDWQDADNRAKDRALIIEYGAEYGFSEPEMTYTQDARTLRMLRDFANMRRELQEMRAAAKAKPGKASPAGRSANQIKSGRKLAQLLKKGKSNPTIQGKAQVVSQLIRNQS
jgi:hypothetical protein